VFDLECPILLGVAIDRGRPTMNGQDPSPRALIQAGDAAGRVVLAMFAAYACTRCCDALRLPAGAAGPEGFILLAYLALPLWVILVALLA